MVQLFRDQCQEAGHWGLAGLWGRTIRDLAVTSTVERWEEMQRKKSKMKQEFFLGSLAGLATGLAVAVFLLRRSDPPLGLSLLATEETRKGTARTE